MTDFVKVCKADDIAEGERRHFAFEEETIAVFKIDGQFYAIADVCTHDGGPLEDGDLEGYAVECPRHGACFDVRTGAALSMPAVVPVPTYETKVEEGDLYVEDPDVW